MNTHIIADEDEDVEEERNLASKSFIEDEVAPVLRVHELHKSFKKRTNKLAETHIAVKNLSFRVLPGEVLGLLGPNGAGKSTTMNMLTAETTPDAGQVSAGHTNIHQDLKAAFRMMGYCPQFDAVWPTVTIREHLRAYSVIRGYHPEAVPTVVDYYIKLLKLEEHADKQTRMLSGGTKRKLSFAMAMLGDSKVVLLDEPSTGMDPQSKRVFWDAIKQSFEDSQRGAILTTHYMEEADALCHRIGIMINGQLECIGTPQHLKTKFGNGYQLEVKLNVPKDQTVMEEIDKLHSFMFTHFPNTHILEQFGHRVQYKIALSDVSSLANSFEILEQGKKEISIGEYNFSQATLEQVFLEFAKHQVMKNNTEREQKERSQEVALSRQVTVMHSKRNSLTTLPNVKEEDLRNLERDLSQAVAKYIENVQKSIKGAGSDDDSAHDSAKIRVSDASTQELSKFATQFARASQDTLNSEIHRLRLPQRFSDHSFKGRTAPTSEKRSKAAKERFGSRSPLASARGSVQTSKRRLNPIKSEESIDQDREAGTIPSSETLYYNALQSPSLLLEIQKRRETDQRSASSNEEGLVVKPKPRSAN